MCHGEFRHQLAKSQRRLLRCGGTSITTRHAFPRWQRNTRFISASHEHTFATRRLDSQTTVPLSSPRASRRSFPAPKPPEENRRPPERPRFRVRTTAAHPTRTTRTRTETSLNLGIGLAASRAEKPGSLVGLDLSWSGPTRIVRVVCRLASCLQIDARQRFLHTLLSAVRRS